MEQQERTEDLNPVAAETVPAGARLDRLVHELVFGVPLDDEAAVPPYSKSWAAAQEIRRRCSAFQLFEFQDGTVNALVAVLQGSGGQQSRVAEALGETRALAVSRAAVKSVMASRAGG